MFDPHGIDRRGMLVQALTLVGATAMASACATIPVAPAGAAPATFASAQLIALSALADTIIPRTETPGAIDVEVPGLFSELMDNWAAPSTRAALLGALDRVAAIGGKFADLSPADRKRQLQAFDAAALAPSGAPQLNPFGPPPATDPAYQRLKQLILTLYYLSQPALTQELAYTHVPGRWDTSIPRTPATRPYGGPGMF